MNMTKYTLTPVTKSGARGFTLVEMLIALIILSVAILGMTSLTLTSIRTNLENDKRNAAVRVTTDVAEEQMARDILDVISGTETRQVSVRGTNVPFVVTRTVTFLNDTTTGSLLRQVEITVSYDNNTKSNRAVIYKHQAQ